MHDLSPALPGTKTDAAPNPLPTNQKVTAGEFNNTVTNVSNLLGAANGIAISVKDPAFGAKGDGSTDDTAAVQAAINAAITSLLGNSIIYFPPGTYKITAQLNLKGSGIHVVGAGRRFTTIDFEPSADQIAFYFGDSTDHVTQYFHNTLSGLSFKSSDVSHKKTMAFFHSQGSMTVTDIQSSQNGWKGNTSEGLNLQNIQAGLALLDRVEIYADRPIHLSADPSAASISDHVHVKDSYLVSFSDANGACLYIDDMAVQNLTVDGDNAWIPGKYGLYWAAPTATRATLGMYLSNIRVEQTVTPAQGNTIYIQADNSQLHALHFENISFDPNANGIFIGAPATAGGAWDVLADNIMRTGVAGWSGCPSACSPTASTIDISAQSLILRQIEPQQSGEISVHSMLRGFYSAAAPNNNAVPFATYVNPTFATGAINFPNSTGVDFSGQWLGNMVAHGVVVAGSDSFNQLEVQGSATGQPLAIVPLCNDVNCSIDVEPFGPTSAFNVFNAKASVDKAIVAGAASPHSLILQGSSTNPEVDSTGGDLVLNPNSGANQVTIVGSSRSMNLAGGASGVTIDATGGTLGIGTTNVTTITVGRSGQGTTLASDVTASSAHNKGQITLNAASPSVGTATVVSGCTPACTANDAVADSAVKCAVSSTTLTATGPNGSSGHINWVCF